MVDELLAAEERLHVLVALAAAMSDPHALVQLLMDSDDPDSASQALQEVFGFDDVQAQAVLDNQFRRVTRRDLVRVAESRDEVAEEIGRLQARRAKNGA